MFKQILGLQRLLSTTRHCVQVFQMHTVPGCPFTLYVESPDKRDALRGSCLSADPGSSSQGRNWERQGPLWVGENMGVGVRCQGCHPLSSACSHGQEHPNFPSFHLRETSLLLSYLIRWGPATNTRTFESCCFLGWTHPKSSSTCPTGSVPDCPEVGPLGIPETEAISAMGQGHSIF